MKKLTSLQILMLMSLALGSSYISADYSQKSDKFSRNNHPKKQNRDHKTTKIVVMNEDELVAMEGLVNEAQARMEKEMGKVPTEHSIKKFIHSVVEEFRMSHKDEAAIEAAEFKLSDARIAIEKFTEKLESVDKHRIASTHIHSLNNKLRNARTYVKEHAKRNAELQLQKDTMSNEPEMMSQESVMSDDAMIMNNDSEDLDEVMI